MKGLFKSSVTFAVALLSIYPQTLAHAGVLDVLRGEPAPPQRVAFVGSAEVKQVEGNVMRLSGIDRWNKLPTGSTLAPGDVIRASEGTALLQMVESKSFIKLTPNTILRLVPLAPRWDPAVLSGREEKTGFIVRSCRGTAMVEQDGRWKPVEVNSVLAHGADLRTAPGTILDLFDTQLSQSVRIQGAASLTLDENVAVRRVRTSPSLASVTR